MSSSQTNLKHRAAPLGRIALALVLAASALAGCRGTPSAEAPVHLNPNMDTQDKYKPNRPSTFFEDGRAMRTPPAGTVGRDYVDANLLGQKDDHHLRENDAYWRGQDENGNLVKKSPVSTNLALLERGQNRYNVFCAPCHDQSGHGLGLVSLKSEGALNVPSFHQDYIRDYTDGHLFNVITNGSPSQLMKGYRTQIPVPDRWAVVAYLRALQRSQNALASDVPAEENAGEKL